jgi:hypothetical protein
VALSRDEVYERVKDVLSEQLGVEETEVTPEASFQDDLDADSLDLDLGRRRPEDHHRRPGRRLRRRTPVVEPTRAATAWRG